LNSAFGDDFGISNASASTRPPCLDVLNEIGTISLPFMNWKHKPSVAANLWFKSQQRCDFTQMFAARGSNRLPQEEQMTAFFYSKTSGKVKMEASVCRKY
jgi:hypothetical protein